MAQKVSIQLVSDMSGGEADETVAFALDNTTYEIDLTSKEADKFKGLFQDYIAVARKVSGGGRGGRKSSGSSSSSAQSKEQLQAVRAWAKENGHEVSERGRISKTVQEAYDAAH